MNILGIAVHIAMDRTSGDVWDLGEFYNLESQAEDLVYNECDEEKVLKAIVSSFDKVFGTKFESNSSPNTMMTDWEKLSISELFHELLHHAFNPKKYTSYASHIEGAVHEHAMRGYQDSPGGFEQLFDTLNSFAVEAGIPTGLNGLKETPELVHNIIDSIGKDINAAEDPKTKAVLIHAFRQLQAMIKNGVSMKDSLDKFQERLLDKTYVKADELIPSGTEENIRRWYRQLFLEFRKLSSELPA